MLYMLDTNICIYLMKKKSATLFKKLSSLDKKQHKIAISSIVLSELQFGVANSQHREQSQINLNTLISKLEVLPYTEQCAFYYGEIRAELKRKGSLIGANDLLIASHALAEKAILVTNNGKEFKRINDLQLENWHESNYLMDNPENAERLTKSINEIEKIIDKDVSKK